MSDHPATPTGLTLLEKLDMISWDLTRAAAARIRELEAHFVVDNTKPPAWTDIWDADYDRACYRRSDGATVRWVKTPTGKKPWQGSRWHRGQWKLNHTSSNSGTAETAMDAIDRHWPTAMKEST